MSGGGGEYELGGVRKCMGGEGERAEIGRIEE